MVNNLSGFPMKGTRRDWFKSLNNTSSTDDVLMPWNTHIDKMKPLVQRGGIEIVVQKRVQCLGSL